ncbi:MAG: LytTR family DNA-binding domain-containing protein [Bacteroidota bacterium]
MTQQRIRAIAIDDEPVAMDILSNHSASIPFLELHRCFVCISDALDYLKYNPVDLVFLDINMPDLSGLSIATLLPPTVKVIFTTAHADYAVQGFELAAIDYLLKPIKPERFLLACNRALAGLEIKKNYLFIKSGYELVRIELPQVLFIRSADNYIVIYEGDNQIISRMKLSDIQHRLPQTDFIRVHKSYLIAMNKVSKIETNRLFIGKHEIPISKSYKKMFIKGYIYQELKGQ